jgi:hypothetical protein
VIDGGGSTLLTAQHLVISRPLMFTSSGLGDALAEELRRRLFNEMCPESMCQPEQQDLFHRHSWPGASHLSVCMRRADARTVSHTVVELGRETAGMIYFPQPPDEPGPSVAMSLPLETKVSL